MKSTFFSLQRNECAFLTEASQMISTQMLTVLTMGGIMPLRIQEGVPFYRI